MRHAARALWIILSITMDGHGDYTPRRNETSFFFSSGQGQDKNNLINLLFLSPPKKKLSSLSFR